MQRPTPFFERIRLALKPILAPYLYREERTAMNEMTGLVYDALHYGPNVLDAKTMENRFAEISSLTLWDSELIDLVAQINADWDIVSGQSYGSGRVRAIQQAQILALTDPVVGHIIEMWTDFGFGQKIDISPRAGDDAKNIWTEFFTAKRNKAILGQKEIQRLSETMLNDGEVIFVFYVDKTNGQTTIRTVPSTQITEIITDPHDHNTNMIYKREYQVGNSKTMKTVYYKDWLFDDQPEIVKFRTLQYFGEHYRDASIEGNNFELENTGNGSKVFIGQEQDSRTQDPNADVMVMYNARKIFKGRGYPLITAGIPWAQIYSNFVADRATIQRDRASVTSKITARNAGSRAISNIQNWLQSSKATSDNPETNPRRASGSTMIENESATYQRMSMGTAGADAEKDGSIIIAMLGLAGGVYPHYLGFGQAFRLATATSMEKPTLKRFERYKTIWSAIWAEMVDLVLTMAEKHGNLKPDAEFGHSADINLDSVIDADVNKLIDSIEMIIGTVEAGMMDFEAGFQAIDQLIRKVLQIFSVEKVSEIIQSNALPVDGPKTQSNDDDMDNPDAQEEMIGEVKKLIRQLKRVDRRSRSNEETIKEMEAERDIA